MDKGIWKFLKAQFTIPLINVMTTNTYVKKKKMQLEAFQTFYFKYFAFLPISKITSTYTVS